jgi:hypothetical protein
MENVVAIMAASLFNNSSWSDCRCHSLAQKTRRHDQIRSQKQPLCDVSARRRRRLFVVVNWDSMPVLQRMVALFFVGLVMHLWEEGRFPGGFVEMITEHLHFTAISRTFGEIVTGPVDRLRAAVLSERAVSGDAGHDGGPA